MTLRTHHYLSIIPLFLMLGAGNVGISAWLDYREIRDSLAEEALVHQVVAESWPKELPIPSGTTFPKPEDPAIRLAALEKTLWARAFSFVGAALAVGVLVAEILTFLSLRELRLLQRSAEALAQEQSRRSSGAGGLIKEYAELDATLTTLAQIMKDNSRQARVRMLNHDSNN
jgi:hypothetical protein